MVQFSIIVASRNAEATIGRTLGSVLGQSCRDFEIIVKDGLSHDATLAKIPRDERIRLFSSKDVSVYDAMNQAIFYAQGKFLLFLNCGDVFAATDVLEKTARFIEKNAVTGRDVLYGNYLKNGRCFRQDSVVGRRHFLKEGLCHQSVFFGRELFEKYGVYDLDFKICADYELMTRFFMRGTEYFHLDYAVCDYLGGGISERPENLKRVREEGNRVRKRYFSGKERLFYAWEKVKKRVKRQYASAFQKK